MKILTIQIKLICLLFCMILLTGCNEHLISTTQLTNSAWQPLLVIAFISLVLIPLISLAFVIFSQWKHLKFKITLQRYLHCSLVLMLCIAWFIELIMVQRSDNRLDLILTLCALATQMILVVAAFIHVSKQQKRQHRAKNFL